MHGLDYFCRINKITLTELCNHLGIKKSAPTGWKNGSRNFPKKYKLEIARLFKIPDEKLFLLEEKEINNVSKTEIELIYINKLLNDHDNVKAVNDGLHLSRNILERQLLLNKEIVRVENYFKNLIVTNQFDKFNQKLNEIRNLFKS